MMCFVSYFQELRRGKTLTDENFGKMQYTEQSVL